VIAVVGFNPNKKYLVSPEQRAELLRQMLKGTAAAGSVRVEGKEYKILIRKRLRSDISFLGIVASS
jgi:phosphopantetheine adenylyltransferase